VVDKCAAKLLRLKELGHKLDRPEAAYLRDDIYELRIVHTGQHFRILYFFHDRRVVVLAHSLVKKTDTVPNRDIELAIKRKEEFGADVIGCTYQIDDNKER
jgi:phage-related protein